MNKIIPKKYNFKLVKGISESQLYQHYQLYENYVKKLNEIWGILDTRKKFGPPSTVYSEMRSLKKAESFSYDGVVLHQLYFGNLGGGNNQCYGKALALITRDYGSYDNWIYRMRQVAMSVRGWVIVGIDSLDKKLKIIGQDSHDDGPFWFCYPILALDVYEHAYMIQFGIDKNKYLDIFFNQINWTVVNERLNNPLPSK